MRYTQNVQRGTLASQFMTVIVNTGEGEYELTKMGVLEKARGLKAGEKLLQHVINYSRYNNIGMVYLLTNSNFKAAIHLYEKNG